MLISCRITLALLFFVIAHTQLLPLQIATLQYPTSFHCFLKIDIGTSFQMFTTHFKGNWIKFTANESIVALQPEIDIQNVLYNQPYADKIIIGLFDYLNLTQQANQNEHLHYVKVKLNDSQIEFLLPTFSKQMKAFRIDQLYRCSNTLISVNWVQTEAHVWKLSSEEEWIHVDDLQGAQVYRDKGVLYGYAIDYNQAFPIKIRIGQDSYCLLDKDTKPAKIIYDWTQKSNYNLSQVLEMIERNVKLINEEKPQQTLRTPQGPTQNIPQQHEEILPEQL